MKIQDDYIHFQIENKTLIEELKEHKTLTYEMLEPVFKVLDFFIEVDFKIDGEDEMDLVDIFQIGFEYLYQEVDNIKTILEEHFDSDIEEMIKYDQNLYLYLRIDEVDTMCDSKNELISSLLDQIENTMTYRKDIDESTIDKIDAQLEATIASLDGEQTIPDIFYNVSSELNLNLI